MEEIDQAKMLAEESIPDRIEDLYSDLTDIETQSEAGSFGDPNYVDRDRLLNFYMRLVTENNGGIDEVFSSLPSLVHRHPRVAFGLLEIMGQNPVVSPTVFVQTMAHVINDPLIDDHFRDTFLHSFIYLRSVRSDDYDQAFVDLIDFEDQSKFAMSAYMLQAASSLHNMSRGVSWIRDNNTPLYEKLRGAVDGDKGSVLLHMRAKLLVDKLDSGQSIVENDKIPFLLSDRRYAFKRNGTPYISKEIDYDAITKLIETFRGTTDIREQEALLLDLEGYFDTDPVWFELPKDEDRGYEGYLFMTPDEEDYLWLISKPVREVIEREFHFKISDLSIEEQFHFLGFLKSKETKDVEPIKKFIAIYGKEGFRTFLSLDYGRDFGDKIIEYGNKHPDQAANIFAKYSDLINEVAKVTRAAREFFSVEDYKTRFEIIPKLEESLMQRGRKLLEQVALRDATHRDIEALQRMNADVVAYGALAKSLQGSGITFEQIVGARLETRQGGEFSSEEKGFMHYAFRKNREDSDPKVMIEISEDAFENALNNPDVEFRVLYFEEKPVAFVRFEQRVSGEVYAGSLNTAPELKGEYIATKFLINELKTRNKDSDITAEVWSGRPLSFYKKRCGFEEEGTIDNWHGTGERFVKLRIPKGKLASMQEKNN